MNITSAWLRPAPKTVCVPVLYRSHASQPAAAERNRSRSSCVGRKTVASHGSSASLAIPLSVPNRLAGETSPYLLQHAHNPVDWYPWGPEALSTAQTPQKPIQPSPSRQALEASLLDAAAQGIDSQYDPVDAGFGNAPKFPQPMAIEFLLRYWHRTRNERARNAAKHTLDLMARGGMYDQLGGGFHRYSTDATWLVPHFEKMLYDNAQLARAYLMGYQATGNAFYRVVLEQTLNYVLRDMTDPSGGFYSTEDADSEGVEGKFYVWTPAELDSLLGDEDARLFAAYYDVTERGNFEHGS